MKELYKITQYVLGFDRRVTNKLTNYVFIKDVVRVIDSKRNCIDGTKDIEINYTILMSDGSKIDTTGDNQLIKDLLKETK